MSFRLIYGKSGTGKSKYIFDEIKNKVESGQKIYIITPEQFSFTAEKKLLEAVNNKAVINAEVVTFNRMAYRVLNEVGGVTNTNLSSCGKAMLIYNILIQEKENLKFLGKSDENINLISTQITEFKKHGVSVENLEETLENTKDKYLKAKMQDMLLVYRKFQDTIQDKYIDENDVLTNLAEKIDETDMFKDTLIYIDEFVGFTKQEYDVIRKLLNLANQVSINICTDSIESSLFPESDIFYANKQTVDRLLKIVKDEKVSLDEPIHLEKIYRFKSVELSHLEENLYAVPYKKYNNELKNMHLFLANNQYSEIENIAIKILKLVKEENYRYKDIAVITKNIDTYSNLCKAIFNKYEIPVFIDEKKDLSQNIIVKYIVSILEIFAKNWSYESVFNYIKTGFLDISDAEIYKLENYCLKWGIKYNKWCSGDWNFHDEDEKNKEQINRFRELRKEIINPLIKFKEGLKGKNEVKIITKRLYEFLVDNDIDKKLKEKIKYLNEIGKTEIATEYETSWKIIMQVLDEIVLIFGNEKINFEKYIQILKVGLGNSDLGKIPGTQDQVVFGDIDRSRSHKVKVIFIIGLNDGMFPSVNKNEGFFNDADRENLQNNGIELAKGTLERLYEDNFNIYKAFSTAEEDIFFSYSSSDCEGKSLRGSILISKLKKIFPNIVENSDIVKRTSEILIENTTFDELLNNLRDFRDGKDIDKKWFSVYKYYLDSPKWNAKLNNAINALNYRNEPEKIKEENIEKLYGKVLNTSVSKLEQYKSCPFSYYLKYGLKLSEKNNFKVNPVDTGSFMHDVIDEFFSFLNSNGLSVKTITEIQCQQIIEQIVNEKLGLNKNYIFSSTPKYQVLTYRLKKVVKRSLKYIIESLKYSDFDVLGNEVEFKKGRRYEPIKIQLDSGKNVEITGKIDRIDVGKFGDDKYIRIIDYKSSVKDIDLDEVYAGVQLQLLTYLDAACKKEDVLPAGVLYFNLIDPIIKSKKNLTEEELEDKIKEQFKMKGLVLADIDIVKMMDKRLETGKSKVIPVTIDKDGNISNSRSKCANQKEFEYLQDYTNKMLKEISEEILGGSIDIKPHYNFKKKKSPCEYCNYKGICMYK